MPTSSGIWHTGISYSGIPHGTVPIISTGISTHLIIMIPGTTVITPHGTTIPGTMIPGTITHGIMIPGITAPIPTVRITPTPMWARLTHVTGESYRV